MVGLSCSYKIIFVSVFGLFQILHGIAKIEQNQSGGFSLKAGNIFGRLKLKKLGIYLYTGVMD